jgi:hypothetical protein
MVHRRRLVGRHLRRPGALARAGVHGQVLARRADRLALARAGPNEEHWHGATPDRFMEHLALWEGNGDGSVETTWNEPVTGEQYNRARSH